MILSENDLRITLPGGVTGRKFDDGPLHGLGHCMKAVDFIIEQDDKIIFVEVKDPENPAASPTNRLTFVNAFLAGSLDESLKYKFRDTWIYEWGHGRTTKPIHYYVIIAISDISSADLLVRTESLKRKLPMRGPGNVPWIHKFVAACAVFNISSWNRMLPDFMMERISGYNVG